MKYFAKYIELRRQILCTTCRESVLHQNKLINLPAKLLKHAQRTFKIFYRQHGGQVKSRYKYFLTNRWQIFMNILKMIGYTPNITWAIEKHISSFGFKKFFLHTQKFFNKCGMTCENEVRRSLAVLVYSKFCIQALASKFTHGGSFFYR